MGGPVVGMTCSAPCRTGVLKNSRRVIAGNCLKEKQREHVCGDTPLESIKTLSFATITSVIGSAVN